MSERENSPGANGNSSDRQSLVEKTPSVEGSPSRLEESRPSRSRSHSRSPSPSYRKRRSYSRSSRTNENPDEVESENRRSHSRSGYKQSSRSRSHSPHHRKYSRSRSRSYSPRRYSPRRSYYDEPYHRHGGGGGRYHRGGGGGGGRYYRSPMGNRRRHVGNRDNPEPSRCLGVFGLSLHTDERELREVFGKYGPIEDVQVVYDAQSGRSRGFAFVYFEEVDDAKDAKDTCNGSDIDGRKIRVDYSVTKRAHTPTPGIYMGKPTYPKYSGYRDSGYRDSGYRDSGYRGHSPSPYYKRRYSRSRSRSYSPRKYGGYH